MAKLGGIFNLEGTFHGVTAVNSRAYGRHIRKARTKFTLGKEMKESSTVLKRANTLAKTFKDAIDPYRSDFRDGMLWQRLVSLFKVQQQEDGKMDFSPLKDHELNRKHTLSRIISETTVVTQNDGMLNVSVTSRRKLDPTDGRADGYQSLGQLKGC